MGINVNKVANNHRLFCYRIPKNEEISEELTHSAKHDCPFYAGLVSEIENNPEVIGNSLQTKFDTFTIETYDFVSEINVGDKIYISNFRKSFIVDDKSVIILRKGLIYAKYDRVPKATRFMLRGNLDG